MEIIFGREDILHAMAQYVHYQGLLLKDLLAEAKQHTIVGQKIDDGTLRLYVVQELVSHEKLFLLDGPPGGQPDHGVRSHNVVLLDCRNGVAPEPLKRFLDTLRSSGTEASAA